jgi:adenosylmethionine-8-amino-7-oxononanoate aminotransferase
VALAVHRAALTAKPTGVLVYPGTGAADDGSHARRGAGDQILICPPYSVTREEIEMIVRVVGDAIESVLGAG